MWTMTPRGFYSTVAHRDRPDWVLVRARAREDLVRLLELAEGRAGYRHDAIVTTLKNADYPYRVAMTAATWGALLVQLAGEVDYDNFKNAVKDAQGPARAEVYMRVWSACLSIEAGDPGVQEHIRGRREQLMDARTFTAAWNDWPIEDDPEWAQGDEACAECGVQLLESGDCPLGHPGGPDHP